LSQTDSALLDGLLESKEPDGKPVITPEKPPSFVVKKLPVIPVMSSTPGVAVVTKVRVPEPLMPLPLMVKFDVSVSANAAGAIASAVATASNAKQNFVMIPPGIALAGIGPAYTLCRDRPKERTCCFNGLLDVARTKCECWEQALAPSPTAQPPEAHWFR
jgi:hypothetical protein